MRTATTFFAAFLIAAGLSSRAGAAEFGDNSPYYEDDAWYDVSEWFDGNDYNPTDEAWWRWDDETYNAAKDTSGDADSDTGYGYTDRDDNDWYYDYYDPYGYTYYDSGDGYSYGTHYFDYDKDGIYDGYTSFTDWNGDGIYEDYDYYSFNNAANQKQQQKVKDELPTESRAQSVTGKIQRIKQVQVRRDKNAKNTVVEIQPTGTQDNQGKSLIVDLGKSDKLQDLNLKQGDSITVKGPRAQVGQKSIILARSLETGGKNLQIDRQSRQVSGKVVSTHKAKVRGQQHQMAIVDVPATEGFKGGKVAVDLGLADKLQVDLNKGSTLTFTGMPVKVKDKRLVVASSVQKGDQFVQIDRRSGTGEAQPAAARQKSETDSQGEKKQQKQ